MTKIVAGYIKACDYFVEDFCIDFSDFISRTCSNHSFIELGSRPFS